MSAELFTDSEQICNELGKFETIINSLPLQRLKNISFLGAIDYRKDVKFLNRYNRYDHTIGVAKLAISYAKYAQLSQNEKKHLIVAALLHDVGHPPFSHSAEIFFVEEEKINHHIAAEYIIKGKSPLGKELNKILTKEGIDIEWIINVIKNEDSVTLVGKAFTNPFNIDTLDAIVRSYSYFARPPFESEEVLLAFFQMKFEMLDRFWCLKDEVYKKIILERKNLFMDFSSQQFVKYAINGSNMLFKDFFFSDERKFGQLFIDFLNSNIINNSVSFGKYFKFFSRNYFIDNKVIICDCNSLAERYKSEKCMVLFNQDER